MRSTTVALDPSISSCGLAIFDQTARLVAAGRVRATHPGSQPSALARSLSVAGRCFEWLLDSGVLEHGRPRALVSEWPTQYAAGAAKGDRNGLSYMPAVAGALAGIVATSDKLRSTFFECEYFSYEPKDWVQGTSKSVRSFDLYMDSQRGRRISSKLTPAELRILLESKSHDAGDAIGIGLHHLGRLKPTRIIDRS
jgi:hypothetical protein